MDEDQIDGNNDDANSQQTSDDQFESQNSMNQEDQNEEDMEEGYDNEDEEEDDDDEDQNKKVNTVKVLILGQDGKVHEHDGKKKTSDEENMYDESSSRSISSVKDDLVYASSTQNLKADLNDLESSDDEDDDDVIEGEEMFRESLLFQVDQFEPYKRIENMETLGEIDEECTRIFKDRMRKAHTLMIKFMTQEKVLMNQVNRLTQEAANQRLGLDKKGTKQFLDNTLLGEKRRKLLKLKNEVHIAKEKENKIMNEILDLEKERDDLMKEILTIQRQKADLLEPQLITATKDLKAEITQKKSLSEMIQKDLEEKEQALEQLAKQKATLETQRDNIAASLMRNNDVPAKLIKQSDVMKEAIKSLAQENEKQSNLILQFEKEIQQLNQQKQDYEDFKASKSAEYERKRNEIHEMERQCDEIFRRHELARDKLSIQKAEQVRLTMQIQNFTSKIKKDQEASMKAMRDRDIQLKEFRRIETTVMNVKMSVPLFQRQQEELKQTKIVLKREEQEMRDQLDKIRREIDISMFDYLKQSELEKSEVESSSRLQELNKELQRASEIAQRRCNELNRHYEELNAEKAVRLREYIRIQNKYKSIQHDLLVKEEIIADASMECQEAFGQLSNFVKLYEVVKTERNKFLSMIQSANQHISELKEKVKIISNEIDILRQEATNKDKEVIRKEQENANMYSVRDKVKNECNKLMSEYKQKKDRIDENVAQTEKLNMTISVTEEDLHYTKEQFTQVTKDRNALSQLMLERNDELCVLYERANQKEAELKNKENEITAMEDEIHKYSIIEKELSRDFENLKQLRPKVRKMHSAIRRMEKEIMNKRREINEMTKVVEDPSGDGRIRILKGHDLSEAEIVGKIQELEEILATKEEKLIEKDLILEEVTALTEKLRRDTLEKRVESTKFGSELNNLAKQIKIVNKSLMAKASELAMTQASAHHLLTDREEKEEILQKARESFSTGQFDIEEFEKDLMRAHRNKIRRERELIEYEEKRMREARIGAEIDSEGFFLYKNIRTKAQPRPNAYMPDVTLNGELPIPKAYGVSSPFKPSDNKHHFKYYKKQILKPVEI